MYRPAISALTTMGVVTKGRQAMPGSKWLRARKTGLVLALSCCIASSGMAFDPWMEESEMEYAPLTPSPNSQPTGYAPSITMSDEEWAAKEAEVEAIEARGPIECPYDFDVSGKFNEFLSYRWDPAVADELRARGYGLELADGFLEDGNYLAAAWSMAAEPDAQVRLSWLLERESTLHVPIFFELAFTYLELYPTIDGLYRYTGPYIKAGSFRAVQDIQPFERNSNDVVVWIFEGSAGESLGHLCKRYGLDEQEIDDVAAQRPQEYAEAKGNLIRRIVELSLTSPLPSVKWLLFGTIPNEMIGVNGFGEQARLDFASEVLRYQSGQDDDDDD
ncbi:MAG: hypothetical protein ACOYKZ_05120 [Chlamydiia bacterium]